MAKRVEWDAVTTKASAYDLAVMLYPEAANAFDDAAASPRSLVPERAPGRHRPADRGGGTPSRPRA